MIRLTAALNAALTHTRSAATRAVARAARTALAHPHTHTQSTSTAHVSLSLSPLPLHRRIAIMSAVAAPLSADAQIAKVTEKFGALSIPLRLTAHEAVNTVDEFKASAAGQLSGRGAKCLFVKDKKKQLYLLVAANDAAVNLGALAKSLGVAGGPMRMESADALLATLGVQQGAVTPLALVNDQAKSVVLLLDATLDKADMINVHPLTNTATVQITPAELRAYVAATGHEVKVVDLAAMAADAAAAAPADKAAKPAKPAKAAKEAKPAAAPVSGNQGGILAKKDTDFHNWSAQTELRGLCIAEGRAA